MNDFIEVLKKKNGVMLGHYQSNPNLCLAKGVNNTILFSSVDKSYIGLMEIDGKDIEVVTGNCFKINFGEAEIFLSISSSDRGGFTAGLVDLSLISQIDLNEVLNSLKITR